VRAAHPLVVVPVIFERDQQRTPLQLLAYDSAGAPLLAAGRPIDGSHQIVLDERLAQRYRLRVGDSIELLERDLRVVGLSRDTDVNFAPFAFVTYDELLDLYLEADVPGALGGAPLLSFLLIELEPGAQAAAARSSIESRVADVDVYTPAELAAEDVRFGRQLFGPVLDLLVGLGWIAAVLAVGLIMAAAVVDRHRELGIAVALGATPATLGAAVLIEAVLVSLLAYLPALLFARGAAAAVERLEPLYRVIAWAGGARAWECGGALGRTRRRIDAAATVGGRRARPGVLELSECGAGPGAASSTSGPALPPASRAWRSCSCW
jgi:hypothetical protein